ncbi:MAG: PorT family protein [Muribaculaceae bacterium]|nr:PorT family protein [Muribaculaceae bacterium]
MKKLISMLLLATMCIPAYSQILSSRTFGEKKKNPTTWYVRAGLSLNNLTGPAMSIAKRELKEEISDSKEEGNNFKAGFGTRVGYDLEVGFRKNFGTTNLYWGMELGLGTRGGKFKVSEKYEDGDYRNEGSHIQMYNFKYSPFQIGYLYKIKDNISLDAHLGIFASIDFAKNYKQWYKTEDIDESTSGSDIDWDDVGHTAFDAGLKLGIGVWYGRYNFDISWQRGFAPFVEGYPFDDDHWDDRHGETKQFCSSNLIISVGYSF